MHRVWHYALNTKKIQETRTKKEGTQNARVQYMPWVLERSFLVFYCCLSCDNKLYRVWLGKGVTKIELNKFRNVFLSSPDKMCQLLILCCLWSVFVPTFILRIIAHIRVFPLASLSRLFHKNLYT